MRIERQAHGFIFEESIINKYHIKKNTEYTGKWDGYLPSKIPVSIKHIKKGNAIDLADLFRQASIIEEFILIIGFYDDINPDDIYILHFSENEWHNYFLDLADFENLFKNALNSVSNSFSDDAKWTQLRKECVDFWKQNTSGYITVNGKRDHKSQKRWQCSINKTNFFKEFLPKFQITEEELFYYASRNQKQWA